MQDKNNSTSHSSEEYDGQITDTIPYYESFHTETLNIIKTIIEKPEIWLDTGCGTGTLVKKALKQFEDTKFLLSDPSPAMLDVAKNKLSKQPMERLNFLKPGESRDISLNFDGKLDVVTAIQAHHYMSTEDRLKTTKHCHRLLKEGGVYVTFENIRPSSEMGVEIGLKYLKNFQLSRGRNVKTS